MKRIFILFLIFFMPPAFGVVVEPTDNVCGDYAYDKLYAWFIPKSYSCNVDEYLPANALGCDTCPTGHVCDGGTFDFNETLSQGLTRIDNVVNQNDICATNYAHKLYATFTPHQYRCSAGTYLPANGIACETCPANYYCVGGTYSFNETTDQGIISCDGAYAPTGSAVCYQHILHVGEDIVYLRDTKQTTPSLNIQIGENIFYANMTTVPTYMNKDSTHYLHILYEGDDYYVCDDTTYVAPSE